jgi:hypothetical protein
MFCEKTGVNSKSTFSVEECVITMAAKQESPFGVKARLFFVVEIGVKKDWGRCCVSGDKIL